MKNIHTLPTSQPSSYATNYMKLNMEWQNIYITSDEEIKEGDWVYHPEVSQEYTKVNLLKEGDERYTKGQHVAEGVYKHKPTTNEWYKKERKIILTTDPSLDGVQSIPDEFLEWFVENPSCEEVDINDWMDTNGNIAFSGDIRYQISCSTYNKIIIPKEEPKQESQNLKNFKKLVSDEVSPAMKDFIKEQETLEEVAERIAKLKYGATIYGLERVNAFKEGAKWQSERMYSEADKIMKFLDTEVELKLSDIKTIERIKWYFETYFEQFKKK